MQPLGWLDRALREDVEKRQAGRWAPRMLKPFPALVLLTVAGMVAGWLVFAALARLIGADVEWWWPDNGSLPDDQLFDVTRSAATIAALFGGLFAILYAYRKQRVEEAAGHRADAEGLSKRYQDAAEQLGHEKAAVRLAGVYAMARLADEWAQQRQTCIDVLCAYLRLPLTIDEEDLVWRPGGASHLSARLGGEYEIRQTVQDILRDRAFEHPQWGHSWTDNHFNLRGSTFIDLDWFGPTFSGLCDMTNARFLGTCRIGVAQFSGGWWLNGVTIHGRLHVTETTIVANPLSANGIQIAAGSHFELSLAMIEANGFGTMVSIDDLDVAGTAELRVGWSTERQGEIHVRPVNAASINAELRVHAIRDDGFGPAPEPSHWPNVCIIGQDSGTHWPVSADMDLVTSGVVHWHALSEDKGYGQTLHSGPSTTVPSPAAEPSDGPKP